MSRRYAAEMLRVGLTGGIGSGKSTVAQRFCELGAVVIDADQLAREVVDVDSPGLASIRERFGDAVLSPDGSLDRGALGRIVFGDARARKDLEALTHPLIAARTTALFEAAAPQEIVVHDVPLLVELDLTATYHLTVVVGADEDVRAARLTGARGFTAADARARIAAQATDRQRRQAADVWLDNDGTVEALLAQVDALWQDRIVAFNDNLMSGLSSRRPDVPTLVPYDQTWPGAAARLTHRVTRALGERAEAVEHIGSTSVPGLSAKDVIDVQIAVRRLVDADDPEFLRALAEKGFPRCEGSHPDTVYPWAPQESPWDTRVHGSADPGRVAHLHVREHGSPGWQLNLLFRDWLTANPTERDDYSDLKATLASTQARTTDDSTAEAPWIPGALERARDWAARTGWSPR